MFHLRVLIFCLLTLLSFFSTSCIPSEVVDHQKIQIKGSDTMVNLGQAWSEEFMVGHSDVSIAVTGGGSGTGIAAIISGTCDIAQSSRAMKEEEFEKAAEKGEPIETTIVGYDGIAIITHRDNPVSRLTIDQLSDIFSGEIKNWSQVGGQDQPMLVLSRDRNSGTHVFFLEEVLRKGNSKGPEEFSTHALMMPSNQAIVQEAQGSIASIGYVGLGYVSDKQKVLAIAKDSTSEYVIPTLETVQAASYPISRPLLVFTRGRPQGTVKDYLGFVLSPEGQEIVRLLDFVPLK